MATKKKSKKVIDYDPLAWLDEEGGDAPKQVDSQQDAQVEAEASADTTASDEAASGNPAADTEPTVSEPEQQAEEADLGYGFFDDSLEGAAKHASLDQDEQVINLGVELTIRSIAECKALIDKQYANGEDIKLDAAELQKVDSAGLQMIYSLKKSLEKNHRNLNWVNSSQVINDAAGALGLPVLCDESAASGFGFFDEEDSAEVEQTNDDGFGFF